MKRISYRVVITKRELQPTSRRWEAGSSDDIAEMREVWRYCEGDSSSKAFEPDIHTYAIDKERSSFGVTDIEGSPYR
jgi:hypothetical protein